MLPNLASILLSEVISRKITAFQHLIEVGTHLLLIRSIHIIFTAFCLTLVELQISQLISTIKLRVVLGMFLISSFTGFLHLPATHRTIV